MTNEEIEKVACDFVFLNCRCVHGRTCQAHLELIDDIRSLVSQAYEESIKATCELCAAGERLAGLQLPDGRILRDKGKFAHNVPLLFEDYKEWSTKVGPQGECRAASIHAMKVSLVAEPVSSS